ncbi:MAG TPA: rRNA maturation RNase YbeY [Patescibacteria group bacterium]
MIKVIVSTDPRYEVNRGFVRDFAQEVIAKNKVKGKVELEISIVGDRKMHELNKEYRNIDSPTDVLAFPLEEVSFSPRFIQGNSSTAKRGFVNFPDKYLRLGDVIISYPQASMSAAERGVVIEEELKFLIEHGINHLLGIHHP